MGIKFIIIGKLVYKITWKWIQYWKVKKSTIVDCNVKS